jgi:hypothetical protein
MVQADLLHKEKVYKIVGAAIETSSEIIRVIGEICG